jgi:hypothetical protein
VLVLLAEVTKVRGVATAMEAARIVTVLAAETSTQEGATAWDSTAICVKDADDWATLARGRHWRGYREWRHRMTWR